MTSALFDERFSLAFDAEGLMKHAELGFHLLGSFKPFCRAAELVRYHHVAWDGGRGSEYRGNRVPVGSHILHLADRVAVLIRSEEDILKQAKPSPHTTSNDVAHLSVALGRLCGFSELEAEKLHIAGNLHDLAKLAIPIEVLDMVGGLDNMMLSAALHHECLNGSGYPFRYPESVLPLSSRIVAVADTLSALTENRSYRKAMDYDTALGILHQKGAMKKLDPHLVALVEEHRGDLLAIRNAADDQGLREFRRIKSETTVTSQDCSESLQGIQR